MTLTHAIAQWKALSGPERRKVVDARIEAKRAGGRPPPEYETLSVQDWRGLAAGVQRLVWRRTLELRDLTALKLGHPFKGAFDDDTVWQAAADELARRLARVAHYRPFDDYCRGQFGEGLVACLLRWTALEQLLARDPAAASLAILACAGVSVPQFVAAAQARLAQQHTHQHHASNAAEDAQHIASKLREDALYAAH